MGTIIENSRCSSACSGTSDWTNRVVFSGSIPAAIQSAKLSMTDSVMPDVSAYSLVSACQSAEK